MAENETTRDARTQLSDLVRERRSELGLSLRGLEARCIDPDHPEGGPTVKYSWIDRLEKGESVIPPQLPALRGLAAGLKLPLRLVQEAAGAQFFGIDARWTPDGRVRALLTHAEGLSEEDMDKMIAIAQAWLSREDGTPDSSH